MIEDPTKAGPAVWTCTPNVLRYRSPLGRFKECRIDCEVLNEQKAQSPPFRMAKGITAVDGSFGLAEEIS